MLVNIHTNEGIYRNFYVVLSGYEKRKEIEMNGKWYVSMVLLVAVLAAGCNQ